MRSRLITTITALTLVGLGTAGCGANSASGGKVGAPSEPVTLTLADANRGVATQGVLDFVQDVRNDSHGAVQIRLVTAPETPDDYEARIVRATAAGRWDLAWVGGRVLDEVGIGDAAALQVPFLVDNYALEGKIVEGPIGTMLTRAMSRAGVVGIGLLADHMRYFAATAPITSPAQFAGKRMRAYYSVSQIAGWRALHATPVVEDGTTLTAIQLIKDGRLFGLESDPTSWLGQDADGLIFTIGAPIWPRTAMIIAAPRRFDALPSRTRSLLRSAAAQADQQVLVSAASTDAADIRQICAVGDRVAVLDAAQRATFVNAGDAITAEMARTGPDSWLIREILELKGSSGPQAAPPVPTDCAPGAHARRPAGSTNTAAARSLTKAFRPGTLYRAEQNFNILKAQVGLQQAENNAGIYNWRFSAGDHFALTTQQAQFPNVDLPGPPATGTFEITDDLVKVHFNPPYEGDELDRCSVTGTTVACHWLSGNDGWTTKLGLGGMTSPLTLVHG